MSRLRLALFSILMFAIAASADRDVRSVHPPGSPDYGLLNVEDLRLSLSGNDALLSWQPLLNAHPTLNLKLTGYEIQFSRTPENFRLLAVRQGTHFRHQDAALAGGGYYRVLGRYQDLDAPPRLPHRLDREISTVLDFEEDLELISFNEEEDQQPDAWTMAVDETLPESDQSLRLQGNCWKKKY